jgi:hypothetical protein
MWSSWKRSSSTSRCTGTRTPARNADHRLPAEGGGNGALAAEGAPAAAFDTRLSGMPALTGRASRGIARLLTRRGCRVLLAPESSLVSGQNKLLDDEAMRARVWGAQVGETARGALAASERS